MKILVGSLTYPLANGVTTSINTSVDGFLKHHHQMMVVAPSYSVGKARPEHQPVSASEIGRWFLTAMHKKEHFFSAEAPQEIRELAEKFQPDAYWLHTVTWAANAFEKEMIRSDKPKVLTYHTLVEDYGRAYAGSAGAWKMSQRSREVANAMDAVITPSKAIAKRLIKYGVKKPIWVIPTAISIPSSSYTKAELAERFHFPPAASVLLYVGRVSREKNIELLIEMTRPLLEKRDTILLLVGPGDIVDTEIYARRFGVGEQVFCTGPLAKEDTQRIYGGADAFVFASQTETQGLVIGEAMLAGTPVVALDSPIQAEVYPDDVAAVVRNEANFAATVSEVLTNKKLTEQKAKKAKAFVAKNFSLENMISRQIGLFEKLVTK